MNYNTRRIIVTLTFASFMGLITCIIGQKFVKPEEIKNINLLGTIFAISTIINTFLTLTAYWKISK